MRWHRKLWVLFSTAINSFCYGGDPEESLSARAAREQSAYWADIRSKIDKYLGPGHCERSHAARQAREKARNSLTPK